MEQIQQQQLSKSADGCLYKEFKNPTIVKAFNKLFTYIENNYEGIPINEIIVSASGITIEEIKKNIKRATKREKTPKYKFIPTNMPTKKSSNILFMTTYYKKFCIDNNIKFNLSNCSKAYIEYKEKCKANNEINIYEIESNKLKSIYDIEYANQLNEDKSRRSENEKPKQPISTYFRFLADKRKLFKSQNLTLTNRELLSKVAEIWKTISNDERFPYDTEYMKDKEIYKSLLASWESKEALRTNPNMHTSDINTIDTSGDKDKNDANVKLLIQTDITNAIIADAKLNKINKDNKDDKDDKDDKDESDDDESVIINNTQIVIAVDEPIAEPISETVKTIATKAKRSPSKKKSDTA